MWTVVILAGGLATRLRPITETIPKLLVPIHGRAFVEYQLDLLAKHGLHRVVLCVGHLGEQVETYFREGPGNPRLNAFEILFSYDGGAAGITKRLGTAGAIRQALPLLGERFAVIYGDSWLPIDFRAVLESYEETAERFSTLMTVIRSGKEQSNARFNAATEIVELYDKKNPTSDMQHIDYGLSVYSAEIFQRDAWRDLDDLSDVQRELTKAGEVKGWETQIPYEEVGSHLGLTSFSAYVERTMNFSHTYLEEVATIARELDAEKIEKIAEELVQLRERGGRLFFLGVGGSAANASHAVNDFRKIAGIECYAPTDNVSELTARTNDEGWASVFVAWLQVSRITNKDAIFVLSVGGGNLEKNISPNLVAAVDLCKSVGARVLGIVGRDGGYTAKWGDAVVIVPTVSADRVTPHSEAFQGVVWHLLVSHPKLKAVETKWESTKAL